MTKVPTTNSRVQATSFNLPGCPLLLINTYFPRDPRSSLFDPEEIDNLLADIESILQHAGATNLLLAGDLTVILPGD